MDMLPKNFKIRLKLDPDAKKVGEHSIGCVPADLVVMHGKVDLSGPAWGQALEHPSITRSKYIEGDLKFILSGQGHGLQDFFLCLMTHVGNRHKGLAVSVFSQLLWHMGRRLEAVLAGSCDMRNSSGRSVTVSDGDEAMSGMTAAPCYNPGSHRQTCRELGRYLQATGKLISGRQCLSLAGPDGTKVGTDFSVSMAAFLEPETKQAAVAIPQDAHS